MGKLFFPAGLCIVCAAMVAVVLFGRHGEYANPYSVAEGPTSGSRHGVQVVVAGGVVRYHGDLRQPLEVWVTRPEFLIHVEGVSQERPLLVRNALSLSAYGPIAPGVETVEGTLLALTAPGAFFFRPQSQARYRFLVLGDPRDHLDRLETVLHGDHGALFALCLGDLVSRGDPLQYARVAAIAARSPVPVYFTVGNHDLEKGGRRYYRQLFGDESYSFRVGEDLFAVLDTAADYPYLGDERLAWLDRTLSAGAPGHRFVAFHTPPIDPRPQERHHLRYPLLRRGLLRVLNSQGIPLAFASHIHDYTEGVCGGTRFVITGGMAPREGASYPPHGVAVDVAGEDVRWRILAVDEPNQKALPWAVSHLLRPTGRGWERGNGGGACDPLRSNWF